MRFPEEVSFFGRSAIFALVLSVVYWFVSYEWAGTVLLFLFGLGSAGATLVMGRWAATESPQGRSRAGEPARRAGGPAAAAVRPNGPFGDERARIPSPSLAPLVFGFGLGVAALALAFGPWLLLAAVMPIVLGAGSWLSSANAEWRAAEADDPST